jgi:preprotein translocase subunit YajC
MGTQTLAAAAAATKSTGGSSSLLLIVLVFGVLMVFMFRSQRKRQRAAQDTQRHVQNGSRVRTVHGIYGTVVDGDDRNVMLEVAPGVKIKMLRQAIGAVVPDDEPDGLQPTMQAFEEPATSGETMDESSPKTDDRSDLSI